jgi:probable O-glycosylation ligase (exosortase A-associated)
MRDIAVLAVIFGLVPFILSRPYLGVLAWTWISYMNPHRLTYGIAYEFPVAEVIGGALLTGLVFSREPKRLPLTPLMGVWVFLIFWMSLTTLFALMPDAASEGWIKMIKIQLITFVTIMIMQSKERIHWLVLATVVSFGFYGVKGGVFALLSGAEYRVWGPPGTFFEDNNAMALVLVMLIPLVRYLQLSTENKWYRLACVFTMSACALSIIASYSRGALLASGVMTFFMIVKSRRRGAILAGLLLVLPLALTLAPDKWFDRMSTISEYKQDSSAMGRINAWWFAYNLASDRPLVGGGFGTFNREIFARYAPDPEDFHDAHSNYFEMLGQHGFVGLFAFLLLGYMALRNAKWIRRNTRDNPDLKWANDLSSMIGVSLIGYFVGGMFLRLANFDFYYQLVAIVVVTRYVVEARIKEGEAAVSAETLTGAGVVSAPQEIMEK